MKERYTFIVTKMEKIHNISRKEVSKDTASITIIQSSQHPSYELCSAHEPLFFNR